MSKRSNKLDIVQDMALARLNTYEPSKLGEPSYSDWIRILRKSLRMTQAELARRAHITQPHLAGIEGGKVDPKISTLKRIFEALSTELLIEPRPRKPIKEILRGRARSVALKRLKQSMGTMSLEGQAPEADVFRHLLEKQTDDILATTHGNLSQPSDE